MIAVVRILRDVIVYRIRKREMANLASSLTIMVAMGLAWADVAVRFTFAVFLNLAVYLTNDIYDVGADLASPAKDPVKAAFLRDHTRAAWFAVFVPVLAMAGLAALWDVELFATLAVVSAVCWAYSARLKRVAFIDLPTILVCAVTGTMLAFPLDRTLGWCLAGLLGLFAACFQTVQMVRDHDDDAAFGTRTTAVALGLARTIGLQRALLIASALYASLLLHRWIGLAMVLAALLPFRPDRADVHWNRIRLALGLAWVAIVAWVSWTGVSYGWILQLDRASALW